MGIYITSLADVLRDAGLPVVEVPGWKTRGFRDRYTTPDGGLLALRGGLTHHTATPLSVSGDFPTLNIIRDGRAALPGPLAQLGLSRTGVWYVVAAGRANHAGQVDDSRYSNLYAIGIEAEHPGGLAPWPRVQYDSYVAGCAALQQHYNLPSWRGHKEAAIPHGRKVDPSFNMDTFRGDVHATLSTPPPAPPPSTDPITPEEDEDMKDLIIACYHTISLFDPSDIEVDIVQVATATIPRAGIPEWFWTQPASDTTLNALYETYLHRPIDPEGLAAHQGKSNRQATHDISNSLEAQGR